MKAIDLNLIAREPMSVYQEKAKEYLSSHRLADFRRSPLLFRRKELGLVPEEDRPAFQVGRAAHTLILEGAAVFSKEYSVGGPINASTGKPHGPRTKAYQEWAEAQGKPVLTDDQHELVKALHAGVRAHKVAMELLSAGVPEGVVRAPYAGVPCQIRMDWLNPELGIVDLKTCDELDWAEADARKFGYAHQLAFYRAVLAAASGFTVPVWMVAVEKREPYRCGVWRIAEGVLGAAQVENEKAVSRLHRCRETDTWPSGYEDVRVFDYL